MMNRKILSVANDFSKYPGGRFHADGDFSADRMREDLLVPALNQYDEVCLNMDGTLGMSASFLEQVFGGLIRESNFSLKDLEQKLVFMGEDNDYPLDAWHFIKSAHNAKELP